MRQEPRLLFGHDAQVAEWVAARIPHMHGGSFGPRVAIGVTSPDGQRVYAGIVYHEYQRHYESIQLSMAADSPLWATKGVIRGLLNYPFCQLKVHTLWTLTPVENVRALRVNEHIGLKPKPIIPNAFGKKKHGRLCQMTFPEYRERYGA